jgi:hypothetical protein
VPKEILEALEQERDKLAFEIEFLQKELVEASNHSLVSPSCLALRLRWWMGCQ